MTRRLVWPRMPTPGLILNEPNDRRATDGATVPINSGWVGVQNAALGALWDPQAVEVCRVAGVGANVELLLGGKTDDLHGEPLAVKGRVKLLSDGRFINLGPMNTGAETRMGPTAVRTSRAST